MLQFNGPMDQHKVKYKIHLSKMSFFISNNDFHPDNFKQHGLITIDTCDDAENVYLMIQKKAQELKCHGIINLSVNKYNEKCTLAKGQLIQRVTRKYGTK